MSAPAMTPTASGLRAQASTVDAIVARSARRHPDRAAVHFADRSWSYAELDGAVSKVARRLLVLGLQKGERVAALGRNSDAYAVLFLACARTGLVHVPINYNATGSELGYLVTQSRSVALFADPAFDATLADVDTGDELRHRGSLRDGDDDERDVLAWMLAGDVGEIECAVADDDLVQLLYTSGTTSAPKGAMMTHRALVHEYVSCIVALGCEADDRPIHALPLYHSAQMHVFLMPYLAVGATNVVVEAPDPADLIRRIEEDGIDAVFCPPTVWIAVANDPDFETRDLSGLRKAFYGASIMPVPILQKLQARLPDVGFYNCFGQSEIGPLATVLDPAAHADRPDSAGRPVLFVELRVVDEDMRDVPVGEPGECVYRSPQLCTGYWDKPEETEEAFAGGWFHSGDLVRQDSEGYIYVMDRTKDVINTGGVLVSSREVEEALYAHDAVVEVAVIGTPHERWIEAVTAVVVTAAEVDADALLAAARTRLSAQKLPKAIHFVDDLPRNASGKILKRELRERFGGTGSAVGR